MCEICETDEQPTSEAPSDLKVEDARLIRKTITLEFTMPYTKDAPDEVALTDEPMRLLNDLAHLGSVTPNLIKVIDHKSEELSGDEAQTEVDNFNDEYHKMLEEIKKQEDDILSEIQQTADDLGITVITL